MTFPVFFMHFQNGTYYKVNGPDGTGLTIDFNKESIKAGGNEERKGIAKFATDDLVDMGYSPISDDDFFHVQNVVQDRINKQLIKK